jgi:citronellol/citronellal dehydrogenase
MSLDNSGHMPNGIGLSGKRIFITGGSRGIGLAIALRAAKDGAHVAIAAKTADPNPKLPGTIFTAAKEIEDAGGVALPIQCDIRDEAQIEAAIRQTAQEFGGIDILINNASAINLTKTEATPAKRFDLMFDVNVRGTFLTSQAAIPYLRESGKAGRNPQILTLSPPLSMNPKWFKNHVAYTMAKYGMSMCVLGMAEEFKRDGIGVNALWPRTAIDTAALAMIPGVDTAACRTPEILADAAYIILNRPAAESTGNFYVDDEVLASEGVTDLEKYSVVPGTKDFLLDFFLD